MFCKNCGSPLDDNASFCGNCGAKVNQEKAQAEPSSNKKKHSPLKFVFLFSPCFSSAAVSMLQSD